MTSFWEVLANNSTTASETQTARVRKRTYSPTSSTNNNSSSLVNIWVSNFYSSVNRWTSNVEAKTTKIRASVKSSRVPTCHHSSTHLITSSKSTSAQMNHNNIPTNLMTQIPPHTAGDNNTLRKRSNNSPSLQSWASCSKITLKPYEVIMHLRILDELADDSVRAIWMPDHTLKNLYVPTISAHLSCRGQCEVSVQATIESLVELLKFRGFQNVLWADCPKTQSIPASRNTNNGSIRMSLQEYYSRSGYSLE